MTQLAATDTAGSASEFQARLAVLNQLREAVDACEKWDDFLAHLKAKGMPEARVRQIVDVPVPMDLHLHSNHSDGQVPANKLPWLARVMGLRTIALTDIDSVSGTRAFYGEAMLLGLSAIPGVELSTGIGGLDILVYFPDAGRFFDFLTSPRGRRFQQYLEDKQAATHEETLRILESVNRWMKRQGIPPEQHVTVQELDAWFGGQKPYYAAALGWLGLLRLTAAQREALSIRDARMFMHKVVTPAAKRLAGAVGKTDVRSAVEDVRKQLASLRRSRAASVAILSHPRNLVTRARMSIGQVGATIEYLTAKAGLDGVEVGGASDTAGDVRIWLEIIEDLSGRIRSGELKAAGPLLVASYASEFRTLSTSRAASEHTLGFGVLDERAGLRRGNLRPHTSPEELLEAMRHRASLRTAEP